MHQVIVEILRITKRDIILAAHCPRLAWLSKRSKPTLTIAETERMRMGARLGELAREIFPDGQLMPFGAEGVEMTREAIASGAELLFEPSFQVGNLHARVDVLHRLDSGWRLIEFKSSKEPKEEHFADVFFQVQVLKAAGLDIDDVCLGLVNGNYVYDGVQLDGRELFRIVSVSSEAAAWMTQVADWTELTKAALSAEQKPDAVRERKCYKPSKCVFFDDCHPDAPRPSIYLLPHLNKAKEAKLIEFGIQTVGEIEDESLLSESQARYWRAVRSGEIQIQAGLHKALDKVHFPAVFLDFEATLPAIPVFPNTRPFETVAFQWSAHVLHHSDDKPDQWEHFEFLSDGKEDPRSRFCETLEPILRLAASVVHYSPYESTQLRDMDAKGIPHAAECYALMEEKKVDLEAIIKNYVTHPDFEGKTSIKKVLPVLVPELGYGDLVIQGGDAAQFAFLRIADQECPAEEREEIAENLLAYCKRDTEAMIFLYQVLRRL